MPSVNENPPLMKDYVYSTIASGQSASDVVDLVGCNIVGFYMPAAFTGTSISFRAAAAVSDTPVDVYLAGALITVPVVAGKFISMDNLCSMAGIRFIQLVSNVAEAAQRKIQLAVRPV